jgi:uncharacterized protein (TIGR01319 family)
MSETKTILATDCGSTTTKAILIEKQEDQYRLLVRGEAPTTVEAPFEDVTVGVLSAVREVEELTGRSFLRHGRVHVGEGGADLYLSTSSAGGGLQMTVIGLVKSMTAESAERAALGAGAIVMDVIAIDDQRRDFERIERIRDLRPDMILFAGGTDGGNIQHVVELAEFILAADPKPRLGIGYRLPVIYAGNREARSEVQRILQGAVDLRIVDNIRPTLETENLGPARQAIHELFLEHVMQQAPGYHQLSSWVNAPIMPTPAAVGTMMQFVAEQRRINVLGVDIGGATTDVFSVFDQQFHRTVSANLGMSYSVCNVLAEAGTENITRWVPFVVDEDELRNSLRNKMVRPTTIPQWMKDLLLEQALAREALRLALEHHRQLAVGLKGIQLQRTIADALSQTRTGETLIDMMALDLIIGSGGVLSHAPERAQAALMLLDAFQPEGFTELAVDSIFMMPQLGVLSTVVPEAAEQVFDRDCLIRLGTAVAPVGTARPGEPVATVSISGGGLNVNEERLSFGELQVWPLPPGAAAEVSLRPQRGFDVGEGRGRPVTRTVSGGVVGLILDGRGRPLDLAASPEERIAQLQRWLQALGLRSG